MSKGGYPPVRPIIVAALVNAALAMGITYAFVMGARAVRPIEMWSFYIGLGQALILIGILRWKPYKGKEYVKLSENKRGE